MISFIIPVKKFFELDTGNPGCNFNPQKKKLVIPLYQREFKWTDEKITGLLGDIFGRDKFLGNIILDEQTDHYEIVDGQQRITTCFLTLLCLYNHYAGSPREQNSIKGLLKPNGNFFLVNETIGDYIQESGGLMELSIQEAADVYYQNADFERAYHTISERIKAFDEQQALRGFKSKLLDCELLVLINNQHRSSNPIEQIFLDINEKAQLLEVEDIFKGHCFENYDDQYHQDLRETWVSLKKQGMKFREFHFEDLSQYIYLYLLNVDTSDLPEKLTIAGKHYLDGKTMDETEAILKDMITYGEAAAEMYTSIHTDSYRFEDICADSYAHRNTADHKTLKLMLDEMLSASSQYQKLPLFYFLYCAKTNSALPGTITHPQLKTLITNLYVYATLFVYTSGRKSKKVIDHTLRNSLREEPLNMPSILAAAKNLRIEKVNAFEFPAARGGFEWLAFAYSIIDQYDANQNWLSLKYRREDGYNLEHFLIPDNKRAQISWVEDGNEFSFSLRQDLVSTYKKCNINYLILDENLNGEMGHNDIVDKIERISRWFTQRSQALPNHIALILHEIQGMPEYDALAQMKGKSEDHQKITEAYNQFLEAYFHDDHAQILLAAIAKAFKDAFHN